MGKVGRRPPRLRSKKAEVKLVQKRGARKQKARVAATSDGKSH